MNSPLPLPLPGTAADAVRSGPTPLVVLDPHAHDPFGEAARLRAHGPLVPVELPDGVRVWAVTDQALIKVLFTHPAVSKKVDHWTAWQRGEVPPTWSMIFFVAVESMFTADGDDHARLRRLVAKAFTRRPVEALAPSITAAAAELITALPARAAENGGVVDLRAHFAQPLPLTVICDLMGAPARIRPILRDAATAMFDQTLPPEKVLASRDALYQALNELIVTKRANPGEDLVTALIAARDSDDGQLSQQELLDTLVLLFAAGHETTTNLFANAIDVLLSRPDVLTDLGREQLTWARVVEEVLRWAPPVATVPMRYATTDIPVQTDTGTVVIRQGEALLAHLTATARHPQVHGPSAAVFDPYVEHVGHVAFGHGPHHCLGAPLARLEATLALPALFTAFPELRPCCPDDPTQYLPSLVGHGPRTVTVHLGQPPAEPHHPDTAPA
jgi:cytochrome P450